MTMMFQLQKGQNLSWTCKSTRQWEIDWGLELEQGNKRNQREPYFGGKWTRILCNSHALCSKISAIGNCYRWQDHRRGSELGGKWKKTTTQKVAKTERNDLESSLHKADTNIYLSTIGVTFEVSVELGVKYLEKKKKTTKAMEVRSRRSVQREILPPLACVFRFAFKELQNAFWPNKTRHIPLCLAALNCIKKRAAV